MTQQLVQYTIWGDPEPLESSSDPTIGRNDDAPVPYERENLWPSDLAKHLGNDLLEKLYGDIPRVTRLRTKQICRRLQCDSNTVANRRNEGSFDAVNIGADNAFMSEWRYYRYSLVTFLFNREFRDDSTRSPDLSDDELDRIYNAIAARTASR